jgi:hypothetical protein
MYEGSAANDGSIQQGVCDSGEPCFEDTFVVNQNWFSASTLVEKIATFAKPENVMVYL